MLRLKLNLILQMLGWAFIAWALFSLVVDYARGQDLCGSGFVGKPYCTKLFWTRPSDTDVKNFTIYCTHPDGTQTVTDYGDRNSTSIPCEAIPATMLGPTTVCTITATDFSGNESEHSNEALICNQPAIDFQVVGGLPDQPSDSVTVSNLVIAPTWDTLPFAIVLDGLIIGANAYGDRNYTVQSIPAGWEGMTYIQTANDAKSAVRFPFMEFSVDAPAEVCVALDGRIVDAGRVPSWLDSWTFDILSWIQTSDTRLELYCRDVEVGPVVIGGNEAGRSMYVVVVRGR